MEAEVVGKSYTKNFFKTYFWQGLGLVLHILSLFIVVPWITDNKVVYGVYSICISTAMFLSYADLGFVSAGLKYAGECFARGEKEEEIKFYGFSSFILATFIGLIAIVYLIFSFNPTLLIKDISDPEYLSIASKLLFIQAIFSFSTVLQRLVTGIFQVRVEQFVYQRINIAGSAIKIASVFYFFGDGKYDIVGYFLFIKVIELLTQVIGVFVIQYRYKYSLISLIKAFRFNKSIFKITKSLAIGSLFVTAMWILYYELDIIIIGRMFGAHDVAIFALAFTFLQFLRSLSSIILSPFQSRYNHFIGVNKMVELKSFFKRVILFTMPIFILLILSVILIGDNLVLSWAGDEYIESGLILKLLVSIFMFSFITVPAANMLVALERVKEMYKVNLVMVILYWVGILVFKDSMGILAFPLFKLIAGISSVLFYISFVLKLLEINLLQFIRESFVRMLVPVTVQILFLLLIREYLPSDEGTWNLALVIGAAGLSFIMGFITLYIGSSYYRTSIKGILSKIL